MEFFEAVAARRSYRGAFKKETPSEERLRQIAQAGLDAPSGKNLQTTQLAIVNDPEILARIRAVFSGQPFIETAPAFIAAIVDANPVASDGGPTFPIEDCSAAVENMLLAIAALGYASVWLDGALRKDRRAERVGEAIGLPADKKVQVLLPVGVAAESGGPRPRKLAFRERAWFNAWKKS